MIALVEGAERQKTPNEIALNILIAGADDDLPVRRGYAAAVTRSTASRQRDAGRGAERSLSSIALLVCLIPTTIGGLLSAIGIAGMDRVMQHNVLAMSGKAVEAAGDVNTLLLDKTGTSRWATARRSNSFRLSASPKANWPTRRNSPAWPTRRPEGRSDRRPGEGEVRPARPRRRRASKRPSSRSRPTRG